jgi:hypothetical protein
MNKIMVVAIAATALCFPAVAQQQSTSPGGQQRQPQSRNNQQETQRIINEEKQELAEDQAAPNVPLGTTGQGSRSQQGVPSPTQDDSPRTFGQGSRN